MHADGRGWWSWLVVTHNTALAPPGRPRQTIRGWTRKMVLVGGHSEPAGVDGRREKDWIWRFQSINWSSLRRGQATLPLCENAYRLVATSIISTPRTVHHSSLRFETIVSRQLNGFLQMARTRMPVTGMTSARWRWLSVTRIRRSLDCCSPLVRASVEGHALITRFASRNV